MAPDAPQARRTASDRVRTLVPLVLMAGTVVTVVWSNALPLTNGDTYFHLRFGREFLDGWSLRHPGSVSSFATAPWVPTQWLPEVVMARAEQWGGLPAVAWLSGLQQVLLVVVLYAAGRRWADPVAAAPIVVLAMIACGPGLSMRPQVLSYVLMAVSAAAWLGAQRDGRVRWWLVPLTWLWAMLHGMWPVGILLGVVAVAGMALDRDTPRRVLIRHLAVPALSAVAAALTPVGPGIYPAVLLVSARAHFFTEWAPPDFVTLRGAALVLLFVTVLVSGLRRGPTSWGETSVILFAGACALYNNRTLPLAAVVLVPLAARAVQVWLPERAPASLREKVAVVAAAVSGLVALATIAPHTADRPRPEPSWLTSAVCTLPEGTRVVDTWGDGGYLMWRCPNLDLLMHGYADTFTDAELTRNRNIGQLAPGWNAAIASSGARVALLAPSSPLAYALLSQEQWTVLHSSDDLQMLVAPASWPRH